METEERANKEEESVEASPVASQDTSETEEAVVPKGLSSEEQQELKERALSLVQELGDASGSQELELVDRIFV